MNAILSRLFRIAQSPTLASGAASWGINALAGHVRELEAAKAELEAELGDLAAAKAELEGTIVERRRQLAELDDQVADVVDGADEDPVDEEVRPHFVTHA